MLHTRPDQVIAPANSDVATTAPVGPMTRLAADVHVMQELLDEVRVQLARSLEAATQSATAQADAVVKANVVRTDLQAARAPGWRKSATAPGATLTLPMS